MENEHRVVATTHSKWPFVLLFLLILILIPTGIFVYAKVLKNEPAPSPTPLVFSSPSPSPSPSQLVGGLKTFQRKESKNISQPRFSLSYPEDWALNEEVDEKIPKIQVSLERNGYAIVILQGDSDGGPCAYDDIKIPLNETRFVDNRDKIYKEIKTGIGTLRRSEENVDKNIGYSFCQERNEENWKFWTPVNIGSISYGGPAKWESGVLDEMDKIIESIKEIK